MTDGTGGTGGSGFLAVPAATPEAQRLYDDDVEELGYVMNVSRLWAQAPGAQERLFELVGEVARAGSLSFRHRAVLVLATAAARGDSYCALAWSSKLVAHVDGNGNGSAGDGAALAAAVLRGDDAALDPAERALARWARRVVRDPNGTTEADVQALRDAGFDDGQVFAVTTFVALRLAFSTVNDALGARPDGELAGSVPAAVRDAVTFGRPPEAARD